MNRFTKFGIAAVMASPLLLSTAYASVLAPSVGPVELMISSGASSNTMLVQGNSSVATFFAGFNSSTTINGWSINVVATSSAPTVTGLFGLDLSSLAVTCAQYAGCSGDPLTIAMSATGFSTSIGPDGLVGGFGGSAIGGTATSTAYYDTNNNYFCTSGSGMGCTASNEIGTASLHGTVGGTFLGGPVTNTIRSYSLTIVDTFATNSNSLDPTYSADTTLTQAPEPGALAMFAAGLLGCALFINRRRRASRQS